MGHWKPGPEKQITNLIKKFRFVYFVICKIIFYFICFRFVQGDVNNINSPQSNSKRFSL